MKPSDVLEEWARLPVGFLETLIEYRAYAAAKRANDVDPTGWSSSPLRTLAFQIEMALAQEEMTGE